MKLKNELFNGKVLFNEYDIDLDADLSSQEFNLCEDLVQVKYPDGVILDIGWYPEFDVAGKLILQLIRDEKWDAPIYKKEITSNEMLIQEIDAVKNMYL